VSVAVGGFLIYYVSWYEEAMRRFAALDPSGALSDAQRASVGRSFLIGIAVFVTSISLASLVGALFGSSRALVRARETPWGTYVLAGLIAVVAFCVMQLMREALAFTLEAALADRLNMSQDPVTRLKSVAPWAVLPFLTAFTISRLARQSPWRVPFVDALGRNATALIERIVDGIVLGLVMIPGFAIALALMQILGLKPPPILKPGFDADVMRNLFVFGFFVGLLVVRDVRAAAHAQLVVSDKANKQQLQRAPAFASAAPAAAE
jgi:hypothetical protein